MMDIATGINAFSQPRGMAPSILHGRINKGFLSNVEMVARETQAGVGTGCKQAHQLAFAAGKRTLKSLMPKLIYLAGEGQSRAYEREHTIDAHDAKES